MITDAELSNIEARADVSRLAAEVRRLRAENERLRGASAETTVPAKPAKRDPKFKVGDRVRYVGKSVGVPVDELGTIKAYDRDGERWVVFLWAVEFDCRFAWGHICGVQGRAYTTLGHGWWCHDDDLELVEQTPAVARHSLPTTPVVSHEQPVRDTQAPLLIDDCEEQRAMATMAAKEDQ